MSIDQLTTVHPVILALCAGIFTWSLTALGAAVVFLTKEVNKKFLHTMLGFAAGIMVAASFWSLLAPCIKMSREMGLPAWLPACVGFLAGCFFLRMADKFIPHLHLDQPIDHAEGVKTNWKRTTLLVVGNLTQYPRRSGIGSCFRCHCI